MKHRTIIFGIILFSVFLILCVFYKTKSVDNNKTIPKKVWTFWDKEELPDLVEKCIQTWKTYNPDYSIIVLNKSNLHEYLPDVDFTKIKHVIDSPARYSDMVRLYILSKYGGIWSDSSIICLKPYDSWIPHLQKENNCDFIGFYIDSFTLPEYKKHSPIIESWFFGCSENNILIKDWLNEFLKISNYDTILQYIDSLKEDGVNIQNINIPEYLTIHVSLQKVLQKGPNKPYNFGLLKAEDTAFKFLNQNNWETSKAIQDLLYCKNKKIEHKCNFYNSPIIKLRGDERKKLEKKNYESIF